MDDSYTIEEGQTLNVGAPGVLGNDTDADGDRLSAVLASWPLHGAAALSSDGSFTYTPNPNWDGVDTFTYVANDGHADSDVATVTITVISTNEPPVADAGEDQTVEQDRLGGALVPLGAHSITLVVDDGNDETDADEVVITVRDTTPPTLLAPADITAEQTSRDGTPVAIGQASASDLCDAAPVVTNNAPLLFPLGTTTVTWTATDASGNLATATQSVTVTDTTPPTLTLHEDIVVEQTELGGVPDTHPAIQSFLASAAATDICDADVAITNNAPAVFPLGTTTVTWTAMDDAGNVATGTQTVIIVDTTAPTLMVPADIAVEQATQAGTVVEWTCSATDICDASVDISTAQTQVTVPHDQGKK